MLPISMNNLRSLASKVPTAEGDKKAFEAQQGRVIVHTGRIVVAVSNFTSSEDGLRQFGDETELKGRIYSPWLVNADNQQHSFVLSQAKVAHMHKIVKAWLAGRTDPDMIPLVLVSAVGVGAGFRLDIEAESEVCLSDLNFGVTGDMVDCDMQGRDWAFNAVELRDLLDPHARLKDWAHEVRFSFSDDGPLFVSSEGQGHDVLSAGSFEFEAGEVKGATNAG